MRLLPIFVTTLLPFLASAALGDGDVDAGKGAYSACIACHGANGEGNAALNAPRLAHLDVAYMVAQLNKFRSGVRGGPESSTTAQQMAGMAATLSNEQALIDVATYIVTFETAPPAATLEGDAAVGADYYNQFCGACHGAAAQGNVALNSPNLAGADDWYLLSQLKAFRAGTRGAHPDDRTGRQMRAMAALLPDDKIVNDVVVFIHGSGQK